MEKNRVAAQWPFVERKLTIQYPLVPRTLWTATDGEYDKIVVLIRDTYAPGRAAIMIEAEVRDWLNTWTAEAEALQCP